MNKIMTICNSKFRSSFKLENLLFEFLTMKQELYLENSWFSRLLYQLTLLLWQHLRLPPLVRCGQVCSSSNQIAGFFDQQYQTYWGPIYLEKVDQWVKAVVENWNVAGWDFLGSSTLRILNLTLLRCSQ